MADGKSLKDRLAFSPCPYGLIEIVSQSMQSRLNRSMHKVNFSEKKAFGKHCEKRNKCFSNNVFYPIKEKLHHLSHNEIIFCKIITTYPL